MKTIRKNSKQYSEVINSQGFWVYKLDNCFKPEAIAEIPEYIKLMKPEMRDYNGKIEISVHSNLWYRKAA